MQTLKFIGAAFFGLLALGSLMNLFAFVLLQTFRTTQTAIPVVIVLVNLALALLFATLCVLLWMSAAKTRRVDATLLSPLPEVPQDKR